MLTARLAGARRCIALRITATAAGADRAGAFGPRSSARSAALTSRFMRKFMRQHNGLVITPLTADGPITSAVDSAGICLDDQRSDGLAWRECCRGLLHVRAE